MRDREPRGKLIAEECRCPLALYDSIKVRVFCSQMLECSMPAVMAWKAWRTQSSPEAVRELVAEAAAEATNACRITPSRHYDCRVREIEAQRKVSAAAAAAALFPRSRA